MQTVAAAAGVAPNPDSSAAAPAATVPVMVNGLQIAATIPITQPVRDISLCNEMLDLRFLSQIHKTFTTDRTSAYVCSIL